MSEPKEEANPLQKKLSPAQFNASIKFYEADHQLEPSDRVEITSDLQNIVTWTSIAGYTSGMAGFFGPTVYRRAVNRLPVPNGKYIYKPFMSFLLGLSTMLVAHQGVGKLKYNSQIAKLESLGSSEKAKQLNVWKAMDYHQAGLFYLYYRQSSVDPSFILKDPRSFKEHEVIYHPPRVNQHHSHTQEQQNESKSPQAASQGQSDEDFTGSQWEKLRKENGFEGPVDGNDGVVSQGKSAWDKLREKK